MPMRSTLWLVGLPRATKRGRFGRLEALRFMRRCGHQHRDALTQDHSPKGLILLHHDLDHAQDPNGAEPVTWQRRMLQCTGHGSQLER